MLRLGDLFIILLAFTASVSLRASLLSLAYFELLLPTLLLYLLLAETLGANDRQSASSPEQAAFTSLLAWGLTVAFAMLALFFLNTTATYSRAILLSWFALTALCLMFWRTSVLRRISAWATSRSGPLRVGILAGNDAALSLASTLAATTAPGTVVVYGDQADLSSHPSFQGDRKQLIMAARNGELHKVFVPLEDGGADDVAALARSSTDVFLVPPLVAQRSLSNQVVTVGDIQAISAFTPRLNTDSAFLKRGEDLLIALLSLLVFCLPMLLIAALVKLSSAGPVLYGQRRVGYDGKEFTLWKFRSMVVTEPDDAIRQATRSDSRITPIGRFLRRTSLDELPQLFNVFKGDMSAVGPRPHAVAHSWQFRDEVEHYMLRYRIKPGMTGLAQINGARGATDTPEKLTRRVYYDLQYIKNWSLWLDFKILIKTLVIVFRDPNAF